MDFLLNDAGNGCLVPELILIKKKIAHTQSLAARETTKKMAAHPIDGSGDGDFAVWMGVMACAVAICQLKLCQ